MRKVNPENNSPTLFDLGTLVAPLETHSRSTKSFFGSQRDASAVKSKIVVDYFTAWSNIMKSRVGKIGYLDFFSGPGTYSDGTESTPLQIVRKVIADPRLCEITMTLFEDKDPEATQSLSNALAQVDGIEKLKLAPKLSHGESVRTHIEEYFQSRAIVPTFMFLDPFGYVGLTRTLMQAILKDWGCELAFYFNFNRINAAVRNSTVRSRMDELFGNDRVEAAKAVLNMHPDEVTRERILLDSLRDALYEIGAKHVLCYRFRRPTGCIDHHLVFATKNLDPAQKIMKGIMARVSSTIDSDGVGSFEFNPSLPNAPLPLAQESPTQRLAKDLMQSFHGRQMTVAEIYAAHNEGTPFTIGNYQQALRILAYDEHAVTVERGEFMPLTSNNVARRHMSEQYRITFPS